MICSKLNNICGGAQERIDMSRIPRQRKDVGEEEIIREGKVSITEGDLWGKIIYSRKSAEVGENKARRR